MKSLNLKNIVWKEGRLWNAKCLNVGVASFGRTRKEVLEMLQEALELYFEDSPKSSILSAEKPDLVSLCLRQKFA